MLGAFRTVKAAGAEAREIAAIERRADDAWRAGVRSARWESMVHGSNTLAIQGAFLGSVLLHGLGAGPLVRRVKTTGAAETSVQTGQKSGQK